MCKLLEAIINHYLYSPNFNGLSIQDLEDSTHDELKNLVEQGLVEALCDEVNPYIKRFNRVAPIDGQIMHICDIDKSICLYPTPKLYHQ